jgi:hypothetical protein
MSIYHIHASAPIICLHYPCCYPSWYPLIFILHLHIHVYPIDSDSGGPAAPPSLDTRLSPSHTDSVISVLYSYSLRRMCGLSWAAHPSESPPGRASTAPGRRRRAGPRLLRDGAAGPGQLSLRWWEGYKHTLATPPFRSDHGGRPDEIRSRCRICLAELEPCRIPGLQIRKDIQTYIHGYPNGSPNG